MDALPITPHIIEYCVSGRVRGWRVLREIGDKTRNKQRYPSESLNMERSTKTSAVVHCALRTQWLMPNSTSILRPSSNFLSTLFTQIGNEKNLDLEELMA